MVIFEYLARLLPPCCSRQEMSLLPSLSLFTFNLTQN